MKPMFFTDDITKEELEDYIKKHNINPLDILCDLINGYNDSFYIFNDIRSN